MGLGLMVCNHHGLSAHRQRGAFLKGYIIILVVNYLEVPAVGHQHFGILAQWHHVPETPSKQLNLCLKGRWVIQVKFIDNFPEEYTIMEGPT